MTEERRTKTFTMRLTASEAERLYIKASEAGLTIGELMEGFAQDLICGGQSHGSDERDYANRWYDRCIFCPPRNFLSFTLAREGEGGVRDLTERWKSQKELEERLEKGIDEFWDQEEMDAEAENARIGREDLEEEYLWYEAERKKKGPGLDEAMKDLIQWIEGLDSLIEEGEPS